MKNHRGWAAILPFLVCNLIFFMHADVADNRPSLIPFCDLLAEPQQFDNKEVATEAVIQSSGHEVHVYDLKCRSTATDDRSASIELPTGWNSTRLGKKLSKLLRHDHPARVSFDSLFRGSGGPYGPEQTRFRFVLRRLISVEEVSKRGR